MNEMKERLRDIITTHPTSWAVVLKNKAKDIYEMLTTNDEYDGLKMPERVYWFLNDMHSRPRCEVCGKPISIKIRCNPLSGYATNVCSISCALKKDECQEKIKNTLLSRYGVTSYAKTEDFKKQLADIVANRTLDNKKQALERRKATCLRKYGVDSISKCKEIKDKAAETYKNRTDDEKKYTQDRIRATKIQLYGVNFMQNIMQGCVNEGQQHLSYQHILNLDTVKPMFTLQDYIEMKKAGVEEFDFQCTSCNTIYKSNCRNGRVKKCPHCGYLGGRSNAEQELAEFVQQLDKDVQLNTRTVIYPLELDICSQKHRIAIEFDGVYWHRSEVKGRQYHLNKTKLCEQQGIQLVHVFENEWMFKKEIVKSRLKNLFGHYDNVVYARKCEIRNVDTLQSKLFQISNHIQGPVNASVNLGLYFNDELISLMTFGKCRFDKKHEWELLRFCNKLGYHIPGAAGKLLKHFEQTYSPKSLVSYADRRWSQGKVYKALGFSFDHASSPNYWYAKNNDIALLSRVQFQKHKLKGILEKFDESKSEWQNMKDNDYIRIYDCGNLVYEKTYSNQLS